MAYNVGKEFPSEHETFHQHRFRNRYDAGRQLAGRLNTLGGELSDAIVLALPRGGVPVGYELARLLHLPFDLITVRKLGVPGDPELAMGAIAGDDIRDVNESVVRMLDIDEETIERVVRGERKILERRERDFRGSGPKFVLTDRAIILADDGAATGSTMRAAIRLIRTRRPRQIIAAVPVAPPSTVRELSQLADEVVCLWSPRGFVAISQAYDDFRQISDSEVTMLIDESRERFAAEHATPPPSIAA